MIARLSNRVFFSLSFVKRCFRRCKRVMLKLMLFSYATCEWPEMLYLNKVIFFSVLFSSAKSSLGPNPKWLIFFHPKVNHVFHLK